MHPRIPLPAEVAAAPFGVAEGRAAGLGRSRMSGGDLVRPFHGVRVPTSHPLDLETRCRAYQQRMRSCEVFTRSTAAAIHGLPVTLRDDASLDVGAFVPNGVPRSAGVAGHLLHLEGVSVGVVRGLPVVSAIDAWCQLATRLSERELIVIGDALVRRTRPIATMEELTAAVSHQAGRRGCRLLSRALKRVRPRTDSPAETLLRLDLVEFGLPEPEVNVPVSDRHGRLIGIADLAYREYRVIVEYDGDHHRTDRVQNARDVDRVDDLVRVGWRIIRFTAAHVGARRVERLLRVRQALIAAGWRPST